MRRWGLIGAAAGAAVHVAAWSRPSPTLLLVGVAPLAIAAMLSAGFVLWQTTPSYTLPAALLAVPLGGKAVLLSLIAYAVWGILQAAAVAEQPAALAAEVTRLSSTVVTYLFVLTSLLAGLPPRPPRVAPSLENLPPPRPTPRIRLASRSAALVFASLLGFFIVAPIVLRDTTPPLVAIGILLTYLVTVNAVGYAVLRCPRCRKLATISPSGWSSPFVGSKCRWCDQEY